MVHFADPWLSDAELKKRVQQLKEIQHACCLCPRECGVDRTSQLGYCQQPLEAMIAVVCSHGGEEPALSGTGGAGTVFIAGCNMRCTFCQNFQISQALSEPAWVKTPDELAQLFLHLETQGCHNLEWVSPTPHLPALVEALRLARAQGLRLPVIYNSNGYDHLPVLRLLEGIVDVYLPDAKYASNSLSFELSNTRDYVEINRTALQEMQRQVGSLELGEDGLAWRGLLIRHLVLPGFLQNSDEVLRWIASELGVKTWISLMAQYYPAHLATAALFLHRTLTRRLSEREYNQAVEMLAEVGLEKGWVQELSSGDCFIPNFDHADDPFTSTGTG